jgi:ketosteroid isomerase-like protein
VDGVVSLLTDDAWFTMPPVTLEYQGPVAIAAFLRCVAVWRGPRRYRLIATRANGQPAYGFYMSDASAGPAGPAGSAGSASGFRAHGMIVLTLEGERISAITRFVDDDVMRWSGIPLTLD